MKIVIKTRIVQGLPGLLSYFFNGNLGEVRRTAVGVRGIS